MLEPAIAGTLNILRACTNAEVKKVVLVSSAAAVTCNPKWPKDLAMDESCWSDIEFCRMIEVHLSSLCITNCVQIVFRTLMIGVIVL